MSRVSYLERNSRSSTFSNENSKFVKTRNSFEKSTQLHRCGKSIESASTTTNYYCIQKRTANNSAKSNLPALRGEEQNLRLNNKQILSKLAAETEHRLSILRINKQKMSIFNLKASEQPKKVNIEEKVESVVDNEPENEEGLDNVSFCSEDTVEFIRDASEYFLEDDDRVQNEKLYLAESKFHREFKIAKNARLPSLIVKNVNKSITENDKLESGKGIWSNHELLTNIY
jgi:hypothetical protein